MRWLIDAQLPMRLAAHLRQAGEETLHTLEMPLGNRTPDNAIKQLSLLQEYIVVTKDSDFVDNLLLHGNVYKLLLVSTGNITNDDLIELFRVHLQAMSEALSESRFVELTRAGLVIHW
ncbi:MAG: DUF5615 family PIN-like protein [Fimbriimonadales bacterium]|nr:MAG: hypothetical protein KatS3mg018_2197 [Fimbriimonadales bacterium]